MSETDWRARKKADTRRAIQEHALRLIMAKGFEATTVEEIAAAAGVSHMTFFRHFPRKEDVVEVDDYDPMLTTLLTERPPEEPPLTAVHRAVRAGLARILPQDRETVLIRTKLVMATPALRARNYLNVEATTDLFATTLATRAGLAEPDLATRAQAAAAVAALTTAVTAWVARDGEPELVTLVDECFAALGVPVVRAAAG
ncbi:TetR/AcrR family transcriptional regulator [Crossiella sp. NPDC003009]